MNTQAHISSANRAIPSSPVTQLEHSLDIVRQEVKRQITPYYNENNLDPVPAKKSLGPQGSQDNIWRIIALDKCSRSLR